MKTKRIPIITLALLLLLLPAILLACKDMEQPTPPTTTVSPALPPVTGEQSTELPETDPPAHPTDEHVWSEVQRQEPTCTENGFEDRICICGHVERIELIACGHEIADEYVTIVEYTRVQGGMIGKYCKNCDTLMETKETPPGLHVEEYADNEEYKVVNNCLIHIPTKTLVLGCATSVIPDDGSVTIIGESAFSDAWHNRSLIIPEGIVEIQEDAYYGCTITELVFPSTLRTLGNRLFLKGSLPEHIVIPEGVETIGSGCFENDISTISVVLPSTLKSIGNGAFISKCLPPLQITFTGTVAQWNALFTNEFPMDRIAHSGDVICSDGDLSFHIGHGFGPYA